MNAGFIIVSITLILIYLESICQVSILVLLDVHWIEQSMDEARKKKNSVYWIVIPIIGIFLTATAYLIVSQGLFQSYSDTIEITNVEKLVEFAWTWADVYIEGKWQEIHYYEFRYYIDIANTESDDAANLRLAIELKVKGVVKKSDTRTVGTLKSGQSRRILFRIMVEHIYLDAVTVVTLYSDDAAVDQIIVK